MIIGTAGHIDHGKTTLVKALTGRDTDRLPEEKKRGISIELGYAFLDVPGGERLAFIDVPGHERLVHTMVAGATGIDYALLLVAADDGVMPQTREHLAVLSLLGLTRGAVVVTKIDRADAGRRAAVRAEVAALVEGSFLAGAPVLEVSAHAGEGLEALRELLLAQARQARRVAGERDAFRLAIDRAFTLDGVGTVVTGTVHAGSVRIGDELVLVPGERRVRVRSLHAQNQAVEQAGPGQRCAVAVAGVARQEVSRGQWLVAPFAALATDRFDAELMLWPGEPRALRSGTRVQVHVGAASVGGSVAVLDGDAIPPGGRARVQLVLQHPVGAWRGDRVVLRDVSATRTMAGGRVIDPFAPVRYRRTPQRLAELQALADGDLGALLAVTPQGLDLRRLAAAMGQALDGPQQAEALATALRHTDAHGDWAIGPVQAGQGGQAVLAALAAFHEREPDELGPAVQRLRRLALPRWPEPLWQALLRRLQEQGAVKVQGAFVHLPEHGVRLSATEQRIAQKVAPLLASAGFEGAWARDLARDTGESEALVRVTLSRLARRGELHQVVKDLFYPQSTIATLAGIARTVANDHGRAVTAAAFRDATRLGRKRAIQILEYFDRIGLLRRVGDEHRLRTDAEWFTEERATTS